MRRTTELLAGLIVFFIVVGLPLGFSVARATSVGAPPGTIDFTLHAFEDGGFPPEIRVKAGELVRLRFTSADVSHGFIIADLDLDAGLIEPGKHVTMEFKVDEPGSYAYVCNSTCSPSHSKIRGILVVE